MTFVFLVLTEYQTHHTAPSLSPNDARSTRIRWSDRRSLSFHMTSRTRREILRELRDAESRAAALERWSAFATRKTICTIQAQAGWCSA